MDSQKSAFHCFQHLQNSLSHFRLTVDKLDFGLIFLDIGCELALSPLIRIGAGTYVYKFHLDCLHYGAMDLQFDCFEIVSSVGLS